ncbi:CHAT domain-containing protein [Roseateles sp. So40a]|uniref:CHAT domain-containing protein n=1 Tax=Roseateles sp. So40a TaxID=3400226 RepID=UPI003A89F3DE
MAEFLLVLNRLQVGIDDEPIKKQLRQLGPHTVQQEFIAETGLQLLQQQRMDFIIVGSRLAADSGAVVEDGGGLAFCRQARLVTTAPIMLLAPALTSELVRECARIPDVTLYADPATAGSFALDLLRPDRVVEPGLQIRVRARARDWHFEMKGVGFRFNGDGPLSISAAASSRWVMNLLRPDWYAEFSGIGKSIRIALCEDNPPFQLQREKAQSEAIAQLGDAGRKLPEHLIFDVSEDCYPLMLEAVFDPSLLPEPWLARASSVARRLLESEADPSVDLFSGSPAARRALLICADTHGSVYSDKLAGGMVRLDPLTLVRIECERVRRLLTTVAPRTGQPLFYADNIQVLGLDGPVTRGALEAALRDGSWDLIHFAGHTYYQPLGAEQNGGTGFLFVGAPDAPECIDFGDVVSYMRAARFVYLSSCESGNSGFAALAAAAGIHAVLGYRCRVNDRTAAIQARLFYRMLLRSHSLGAAFGLARRRIYRRYRERDNAWASAMLVTPEFRA